MTSTRPSPRAPAPAVLLLLVSLLTAACGPGDTVEIRETRVASRPRLPAADLDDLTRFGYAAPQAPRPAAPVRWRLPEGWEEDAAGDMRQGSFRIPGSPDLDASLVVLPGGGGGLLANVNRWRGQMGLGPAGVEEFREMPRIGAMGAEGVVVDLEGDYRGMGGASRPGYRMLGVLLEDAGQGVFLKLVGPAAEVAKEQDRFFALARSLTRSRPEASFDPAKVRWTAPAGWVEAPSRSMRLVTFHPAGDRSAECLVTVLRGDAGGVAENVNLWRSQMGQATATPAAVEGLPKVMVLGRASPVVEVEGAYTDMAGNRSEGQMLLGVICPLGSHSVFVKFTGPAELVKAEKENFLAFCRSLEEGE